MKSKEAAGLEALAGRGRKGSMKNEEMNLSHEMGLWSK